MIIDPYTWSQVTIQSVEHVTQDTVCVRMTKPDEYSYIGGQYTIVRAKQLIRQYSFTSSPDQNYLELLIQLEPGGTVTGWFHTAAKPGDMIEVSQSFGNFTLPADTMRPLLFIAGRVGIAPFISLLNDADKRDVQLLYSIRDQSQVCYPELMKKNQASLFITSDGKRIDENSIKPYLKPNQLIYLCGSKQFVDSISALLYTLGVPLDNVKRELFTLQ